MLFFEVQVHKEWPHKWATVIGSVVSTGEVVWKYESSAKLRRSSLQRDIVDKIDAFVERHHPGSTVLLYWGGLL